MSHITELQNLQPTSMREVHVESIPFILLGHVPGVEFSYDTYRKIHSKNASYKA